MATTEGRDTAAAPRATAFAPLREHATLEERVYRQLRCAITGGTLRPGQRLVAARIADEMGISRMPVVQALKRLETEGFATIAPYKDAVVAELSVADVEELYAVRAALEAVVARKVAGCADRQLLDALTRENEALRAAALAGNREAMVRADDRFHDRLYAAAAMPRLERMLRTLRDQGQYYRVLRLSQMPLHGKADGDTIDQSYREHTALVEALSAQDQCAAARIVRRHIRRAAKALRTQIQHP